MGIFLNKGTFSTLLVTLLYAQPSHANDVFRSVCRSNDHSLTGLFANITSQPLACARQCGGLAFCNYLATRGSECLLGFGTMPCEWNTTGGGGAMWVTYRKAGTLQICNCGPGMIAFRNSCYIFPTGLHTWTETYNICAGLGGGMVELGDLYEHDFLLIQATTRGYTRVWLGASDVAIEGTFTWNSGASFTFTKWGPTEPNNSGGAEDHLELYVVHVAWNDDQGTKLKSAACELSCF